jgi:hypothetical protein
LHLGISPHAVSRQFQANNSVTKDEAPLVTPLDFDPPCDHPPFHLDTTKPPKARSKIGDSDSKMRGFELNHNTTSLSNTKPKLIFYDTLSNYLTSLSLEPFTFLFHQFSYKTLNCFISSFFFTFFSLNDENVT